MDVGTGLKCEYLCHLMWTALLNADKAVSARKVMWNCGIGVDVELW